MRSLLYRVCLAIALGWIVAKSAVADDRFIIVQSTTSTPEFRAL